MRLRTFGGLWIEDSRADSYSGVRPRGLALLALLAANGSGAGLSRDRILGILWAESDPERARHALSQTLYGLRRGLGVEVVVSTPELRLDPTRITTDLEEFRAAVRARHWTDAAALYVGPFLDGFYLGDAPEFERWAESERATLSSDGIRAIESLGNEAERGGDAAAATDYRRRLTLLDPFNPRFAVTYMEALARQGNREAALAHGKAHATSMQREFEAEPDLTVQQMMQRLRSGAHGTPAAGVAVVAPTSEQRTDAEAQPGAAAVPGTAEPPLISRSGTSWITFRLTKRRVRTVTLAASLVMLVATLGIAWRAARPRSPARTVLAVGRIRDLVAPDSAAVGAVLSEMLATSLGRIRDLQVVANSRMLELTPRGDLSRSALTNAARRAGATEVVEGELIPLSDRQLRVEIRRVDILSGLVLAGYRASGDDRFSLMDSVTSLIAADFRMTRPSGSLAEVSTSSPLAYRLYDEGLQAFYQSDPRAALRFFRLAIREDSTFAMATYYTWRAAVATGDSEVFPLSERVLALAPHAARHDRLLILTHVGAMHDDPRAPAVADTLATSYPHDPEALVRAGEVVRDLSRATQLLNQSIALDSTPGVSSPLCRMCDAFSVLFNRYNWVDSSAASERTIRRWMRLRPRDATPWCLLADLMLAQSRREPFETALRRCDALGGISGNRNLQALLWSLRLDDFDAQNRECRAGLRGESEYEPFRWYCVTVLRGQGRMREAMSLAREGRAPAYALASAPRGASGPNTVTVPLVLMESGQAARAVPLFRTMYSDRYAKGKLFPRGVQARNTTWTMTLAATAAVEAGDTTTARAYVDSIATVGQQSSFDRDPVLHHFVRGLLESRAGDHERAVTEFRAAIVSPTYGYTRINYELARSLLALHRAAEAVPPLQSALRGGIEGSNLYVTRTALHELLAQAMAAAMQRDSATAHYSIVERAWRSADPPFAARYEAARSWLAAAKAP